MDILNVDAPFTSPCDPLRHDNSKFPDDIHGPKSDRISWSDEPEATTSHWHPMFVIKANVKTAPTRPPYFRLEPEAWSNLDEMKVLEPFFYAASLPGKDMRGRFINSLNHWLRVPEETLAVIRELVADLHTASLLIDDIEDNSQLRRGKPVAHKIFGVAQTINCGNYVYFLAMQKAAKLKHLAREGHDVMEIVLTEMLNLHRGQGLDILWRDSLECPSETRYIEMVNQKTSGLLRMAVRLMMACATTNLDVNYVPLVNLFGILYQIRDDLMNLNSNEYKNNKGFAEDLSEGKFSFPVVHGIHSQPQSKLLINVLQKRPSSPEIKMQAIDFMRDQSESFSYSESVLRRLEKQIRLDIAALGGNDALLMLVDAISIDRERK